MLAEGRGSWAVSQKRIMIWNYPYLFFILNINTVVMTALRTRKKILKDQVATIVLNFFSAVKREWYGHRLDTYFTKQRKPHSTPFSRHVSAILLRLSELRGGVMLSAPVFGSKGIVFLNKTHAHSFMNSFRVSEVNFLWEYSYWTIVAAFHINGSPKWSMVLETRKGFTPSRV